MRVQTTSGMAALAIVCTIALGLAQPASARAWRVAHRGNEGADHVIAGSGANGRGIHAGGTIGDGNGGLVHASGGAYAGARGTATRGSYTHLGSDGSIAHRGGHDVQGASGGYDTGHNSYTRNADGSAQGSWENSGRGANGSSIDSSGGFSRSSDGTLTGSSQTSASGARGSYNGSTNAANGTTTHDTDYTAVNGDTYHGETSYTESLGYTHTGSCADAQGNTIACH